jgi:hypothetical protein
MEVYEPLFTIEVSRIVIKQDEIKPLPAEPLTFEILTPKRAVATLSVHQGSDESKIRAVVEFRGDALTLSRAEGDFDVQQVAIILGIHYLERYGREGIRIIGKRKNGRICDCTLPDPGHFLGFLHLLHTIGGLEYRIPQGQESSVVIRGSLADSRVTETSNKSYATRVELADKALTPLRNEVRTWGDPKMATFFVWNQLDQQVPRLVKRVPKSIVDLLNEAVTCFERKAKLRALLNTMISDAINAHAPSIIGPHNDQDLTNVEFRLIAEPGGTDRLYISWIWESRVDLRNYILDFIESSFPPNTNWKLETWVYPRPSGEGRLVGGTKETEALINRVLRYLMSQDLAHELHRTNGRVRELGKGLLALIDAELEKD